MFSEDKLPSWLAEIYKDEILPKREAMKTHPFMVAMQAGTAKPEDAQRFFSGLMWHLLDFGTHVEHLMAKRPADVTKLLEGRSEDEDGDTDILGRIVAAFGGNPEQIATDPWNQKPHPIWIQHDALLRSTIYSTDLEWQVGTAGLNVGIEALVPWMIEPLFEASVKNYSVTSTQAKWLESRAGEEERQHGENGFILLAEFVSEKDTKLIDQCRFFIRALSDSMAYRLLDTGLPNAGEIR
jgi:pyrroloquinoline quinone (PQQ) biosynthesis protein C